MDFIDFLDSSWYYFVGYIYGVWVGDIFIKQLPGYLRGILKKNYKNKPLPPYVPELPRVVGFIERPLYIVALQFKQPLLIGVWLTLKTASRWEVWSKDEKGRVPGRATFNIFLAGNGLSLLYSIVGYWIIEYSKCKEFPYYLNSLIPAILLVLANGALNFWLKSRAKK